jgi:sugar lactone lactonase YvrE
MNFASRPAAVRMSLLSILSAAAGLLWLTLPSGAVAPQTVQHATEADFAAGELHSTAVNSAGEVRLGRELSFLMPSDKAPNVVSALAPRGKTLFAASGTDNAIYRIQDGKPDKDKFATLADATMIGSLLAGDKGLLVGANGEKGAGIYRIDDHGKATLFWSNDDVKYVWAMVAGPQGKLFAATGPKGQVWSIDAQGKGEKLFEAKDLAKNILCLAQGPDGTLYAGTDEHGLVVAIDPAKKTSRVLLSAPEKEISSIVPLADGNVYVATSDSAKAAPETSGEAAEPGEHHGPQTMPTVNVMPNNAASKPAPKLAPVVKTPASAAAEDGETNEPGEGPSAVAPAKGGNSPAGSPPRGPHGAGAPQGGPGEAEGSGPGLEGPGNAVYRIAPDGLVRPLIRRPVSIYAMLQQGDELLLATGPSGQIIAVKLSGDESTIVADTDASQITCLAPGEGGKVYFGTANKGSVGQMSSVFAKTGTFVSKTIDAQQIAKWGTICVRATVPEKAKLTLATRTGNLAEPKDNTWSAWSDEIPVTGDFLRVTSPAGRFLQYRLTFTAGVDTPRASDVRVIYQVGNLAPEIAAIAITPTATAEEGGGPPAPAPAGPGGPRPAPEAAAPAGPLYFRSIAIQAADPNGDQLAFTIEYRQVGTDNWIKVADKLDKPAYSWDSRTVSDGTYEFRVTASDSPSNPPATALTASKVSTPVVVDNTPPVVKELAARVAGNKVFAGGLAVDSGSRIAAIHYSLDSATEWIMILPEGGICDSDKEKFSFDLKDVKPGTHRLSVKVVDAFGNTGFGTITVNVAKQGQP